MMFCKNCGNQNADTAAFCSACGVALQENAKPKKEKHTGVIIGVVVMVIIAVFAVSAVWFMTKSAAEADSVGSAGTVQSADTSQTSKYVTLNGLAKALTELFYQQSFSVLEPYLIPNAKQALAASPELEDAGELLSDTLFDLMDIPPESIRSFSIEEIEPLRREEEQLESTIIKECNQYYISQGIEYRIENIYMIEFSATCSNDGSDFQAMLVVLATETEYGWRIIAIYD